MTKINGFNDYTDKYNTNVDYSFLFGGTPAPSASGTFSLSDYAAIKNGSYGKLLKAYYAKQDAEKAASGAQGSVPVGAGHPCGKGDLVSFFSEGGAEGLVQ